MLRLPYHWRKPEGVKRGIPKVRALWYKMDCLLENLYIRRCPLPERGIYIGPERSEKITVSLTTFPARIDQVYYAIKSLMIQSVQADRIVLWLADSQFPGRKLPEKLQELVKIGLTVRWCEDLRSHKKYFYALQEQKEDELVVTYDDDIIYESDSLEKLMEFHRKYPEAIVCNRAHEMVTDEAGQLMPYEKWKIQSSYGVGQPVWALMPSTGNGCLYPYGVMPPVTFDEQKIRENAFSADDIWMRFCSLQGGVKVLRTRQIIATLCNVSGSQTERLTQLNDICGENQRVIDRLLKLFPNTHSLLLED